MTFMVLNSTMQEIVRQIPDVEVLLALEAEELGAKLLFVLRQRGDRFHLENLSNELWTSVPSQRSYPPQYRADVSLAFTEALAWLQAQGLVVPDEGMNGSNGWRRLSRRARRIENDADFAQYAAARRLPRDALHPALAKGVWQAFMRGEFDVAVFQAMKAVEVAVRDAAGFTDADYGTDMVARAFNENNGPLRDPSAQPAERAALRNLFIGAHGSYKNPHSHRNVRVGDAAEAVEIVMLANHLLRIVDARKTALP
jgi:uncharacterized protein (TIGR02391 family)